jgi:hypothetical protein
MLLGARESILRSAYAVLEPGGAQPRRRPGVLYLTTERLVFESPGSRGLVRDLVAGRDPDLLLDEPLVRLRNASVRRGRFARSRLVVDPHGHRAVLDVLDPEGWVVAIGESRRQAELAREASVPRPHAEHPASSVKVRCRYCRGLADERNDRCPSCGAPL